jgi:toxin ParE1/3/4
MTYMISVRPLASDQLEQGYNWYEDQQAGLGDRFVDAFHELLAQLEKQPYSYPVRYETRVRAASLKPFPYLVYYQVDEPIINIVSVFHTGQNPDKLKL